MTVGAGVLGRDITLTMGGAPIAGVTTKGYSINNEPVDVSDDDSSGFRTLLATPGGKSLDVTLSGVTKDLSLLQSAITNASQVYAMVFTYSNGDSLTMDGFLNTVSATGEYNGAETFDASFQSTGEYTFTAA